MDVSALNIAERWQSSKKKILLEKGDISAQIKCN